MFPCSFTDSTNTIWNCTEQYYQYHKALYFNDHRSANAIRASDNPYHIKRLGKLVQGYSHNPAGVQSWRNLCALPTLISACKLKFSQNPHLTNHLRSHTDAIIAEASPHDNFFGIGLHISDPRASIPTCWTGLNHMGRILMGLKYELPPLSSTQQDPTSKIPPPRLPQSRRGRGILRGGVGQRRRAPRQSRPGDDVSVVERALDLSTRRRRGASDAGRILLNATFRVFFFRYF